MPGKLREKKYKEFKLACDYFFEQRRSYQEQEGNNQAENLIQKRLVCTELLEMAKQKNSSLEALREYQTKFNAIGFVPREEMGKIKSEYQQAAGKYISSIENLDPAERDRLQMELQLEELRQRPGGDKKIVQKEYDIRKKITRIEHDIALLRNNLEFFGRSKNAEKYKMEFKHKITQADDHLKQLRTQLKIINTVS